MKEYMREGRDVVRMRWWCRRKREHGWSGNKIAAHLQVPKRTVYDWITKYRGCGKEEMVKKKQK
jgi:transposase